jgi:hypothetical protein
MSKRTLPPHPATVDSKSGLPPHPATVAQRKPAPPWASEAQARPSHAAVTPPAKRGGAPSVVAGASKGGAGVGDSRGSQRSAQRATPLFAIPFGPGRALLILDAEGSEARSIQAMFAARPSVLLQRSSKDQGEDEKQRRRRRIVTRVLRVDQHQRPRIGIHSTRRSERSIRRNIPLRLEAKGGGTVRSKRLYSYMRRFGGAGMLGFHRDLGQRPRIVRNIVSKMVNDRVSRSRRGPKFVIVAIDLDLLEQNRVLDLQDDQVRTMFSNRYGGKESSSGRNYMNMYGTHAKEGVVVIDGHVSRSAIVAIRAFRGVPTVEEMRLILEELIEEEEEDLSVEDNAEHEDFHDKGGGGFDKGGGFGGFGGGFGGGLLGTV